MRSTCGAVLSSSSARVRFLGDLVAGNPVVLVSRITTVHAAGATLTSRVVAAQGMGMETGRPSLDRAGAGRERLQAWKSLIEPGTLPDRGTLVVPIASDGTLGTVAAELDRVSGGLIGRALAAGAGGLKHGRIIDLLLPAGLSLDRLLLLALGKPDGLTRLDLEEAGGGLAQKLRGLKVREAHLAAPDGLELGFPTAEVVSWLALGAELRAYRFTKYRTSEGDEDERAPERLRLMLSADWRGAGRAGSAAWPKAVCRARDLVSEPGNVLTPKAFADACAGLD